MAPTATPAPLSTFRIDLGDNELARHLAGAQNENLREIERRVGLRVGQRGAELLLTGSREAISFATRLFEELRTMARAGSPLYVEDVDQAIRSLGWSEEEHKEMAQRPVLNRGPGRQVSAKSLAQRRYVEAIRSHDIVFGIGPAGTGKTYLAVAMAVALLQERRVKRIILARPAVEAGEKLGFLPGDMAEKVNPYLRPLYDALHDMMGVDRAIQMVEQGTIEVAPLAFMRGRTLADAFTILDEAQNTSVEQMKMFLTRLGHRSKAVITGDVTQIDLPAGQLSGLVHAQRILRSVEGIAFAELTEVDVVRHRLVQDVIRAYADHTPAPPAASASPRDDASAPEVGPGPAPTEDR